MTRTKKPVRAAAERVEASPRTEEQEADRVELLFHSLLEEPGGRVSSRALLRSLEALGLRPDDLRLRRVR